MLAIQLLKKEQVLHREQIRYSRGLCASGCVVKALIFLIVGFVQGAH